MEAEAIKAWASEAEAESKHRLADSGMRDGKGRIYHPRCWALATRWWHSGRKS